MTTDAQLQPEATHAELLDDLQTQVGELLTTLANLAPMVEALTDTRQRGLGFLTPEGRDAQDRIHRAGKQAGADRLEGSRIATWAPGVDIVDVGPGESPAPGNIGGLSMAADIVTTLHHTARYLINLQARAGICTLVRIPTEPTTEQLVAAVRQLTWQTTSLRHLEAVRRDLEHLRDETLRLIDGNDRTVLNADCPHCGNRTLVVYFADDLIRCDRHPKTKRYEPCTCPDPLCDCKTRPVTYRHEWHRAKGTKPNGWWALADRLNLERSTTE